MPKETAPSRAPAVAQVQAKSAAAAAAAASSAAGGSGRKYVTAQNFFSLESRPKPLPPGANASNIPSSTTLFQLKEHVEFKCSSCRRDRIQDDALALDSQSGRMTCQRCFSRQIRPKNYKPTRLVPFPSLLSWLNFQGGGGDAAMDLSSTASAAGGKQQQQQGRDAPRMAEAVIPSMARARGLDGDGANQEVAGLIAHTPVQAFTQSAIQQQQQHDQQKLAASMLRSATGAGGPTHPCEAVFGRRCVHGATCFFQPAPAGLCLEFLMGLCFDSDKCGREHSRVFELPNTQEAVHPERWLQQKNSATGESVVVEAAEFKQWVAGKKMSKNQAEWQLWNQSGLGDLLDKVMPMPEAEKKMEDTAVAAAAVSASGLPKASAIEALLKSLKK